MIFFIFIFFPFFLQAPRVEAREDSAFDLQRAILRAISHNQELDLIRREEELLKKREEEKSWAFHINISSDPQLTLYQGEVLPVFRPGVQVSTKRELLGGALKGDLLTSLDVAQDGDVESILSISYEVPLFGRGGEERESREHLKYKQEEEELVKRVIESYHALLLQRKEIELAKMRLNLAKMRLEAAQLQDVDDLEKEREREAKERVLEMKDGLEERERTLKEYQMIFHRLLDLEKDEEILLTESIKAPKQVDELEYYLEIAQKNHLSIHRAEERLQELERGEGHFRDSGWSVNLATGLEPYHITSSYHDPSFFIRVQAGRSFSMVSSLKREEEELEEDRALLELKRAREMVEDQVKRTYSDLLKTLDELKELEMSFEESKEEMEILEAKYSLGLIGPIELEEGKLSHHQLEYSLLLRKSTLYLQSLDLLEQCGLSITEEGVGL